MIGLLSNEVAAQQPCFFLDSIVLLNISKPSVVLELKKIEKKGVVKDCGTGIYGGSASFWNGVNFQIGKCGTYRSRRDGKELAI